nr:unnamed protein product [Callosobruchus chinensis]
MAPSQVICACCNKLYDAISMVKCCICKKLLKNSCVDISSPEVRLLSANKGCDWSCPSCRTFDNDLKDLKAIILKLQDDIKTLKDTRNDVPINEDHILETIISEVSERAKRKKNLMIFGVDEQGPDGDKNAVNGILKSVERNIDLRDVKPVRLGRQVEGRRRPIKISFGSDSQVAAIIRNAKLLKNTIFKNAVSLSYDRTPRQVSYYKKLKEQLHQRLADGETDLKIIYSNDVPKII